MVWSLSAAYAKPPGAYAGRAGQHRVHGPLRPAREREGQLAHRAQLTCEPG
jgi:hypothetical protein